MSQRHVSRTSDNPFIDRLWASENLESGVYKATPDGCWDLIAHTSKDGSRTMMLTGQASKPAMVPYEGGTSAVVISFVAGAHIPQLPGASMLDSAKILPNADEDHFMLLGHTFAIPTYKNAEELVEAMERHGLLAIDEVVAAVLKGTPKAMSDRNMQRHFMQTTGLTRKSLEQIHRAQKAVRLIKAGAPLSAAAADAGFTDQPHLSKSLQKLMQARPSDVTDIHKL